MTTPAEDREMATFVAWAVRKYRQHAYRHTSATSGEWAAWQAATALERERCAGVCEGIARQYRADGHGHAAERAANAIRLAAPAEPERGQTDAPICPWCDRQGLNICQFADDAKTCLDAR